MRFDELQLEQPLLESIQKLGFAECTQIQSQAIPEILAGKDLAGLSQTGTGKTAAYLIPLINRILKEKTSNEWKPREFVLVLVPTRELADQILETFSKLSCGLKACAIYGGTGYDKQKEDLRNSPEFVFATPGRLMDLYKEHFVDLKQVRAIVFDEADRMFDMGFKDDMKYILQRIPGTRQFLVFSATLNFDVLNTAYQFGAQPVEINISRDQAKAENVKDEIFHAGNDQKPSYLLSILKKYNPKQVVVFSNYKNNVERIAKFLTLNNYPAVGISSLMSQSQRTRVMELFRSENDHNILVATDVAARGLDVKGVDMVINFDLPSDSETYVHRIGRTGRAGAEGVAFSLVGEDDVEALSRLEEYLKHKLSVGWLEDAELVKEFQAMPSRTDEFRSRGGFQKDRPPRREGGRGGDGRRDGGRDRGPRREGQPRREGGGGHRDQNRDSRRDQNGASAHPRREGGRPQHQNQRHGQGQQAHAGGGQHRKQGHQPRGQQQNPNKKFYPQKPPYRPNKPHAKGAGQKDASIVQKVGRFLKNLFD